MKKAWIAAACALAPLAAAAASPPAALDTLVVVLDAATSRAVAESSYLRSFGGLEVRESTGSTEGRYRSMFLHGRETTLEMFSPGATDLDHPGSDDAGVVGVELSTDHVGELDALAGSLRRQGLAFEDHQARKQLGGRDVDWFRYLVRAGTTPAQGEPPFAVSFSEYAPGFFDEPEAGKAPAAGPQDRVTRARYHRADYDAGRPMRDVAGATLALTREDWRAQRAMLVAAGYRVTEHATGARAEGDAVFEVLFVGRAHTGVRRIRFRLSAAPGVAHEERLGESRLVVGPAAVATWDIPAR